MKNKIYEKITNIFLIDISASIDKNQWCFVNQTLQGMEDLFDR